MTKYTDIGVEKHGHVGLIEIRRQPLNFFDISLINQIADALEEFDKDIGTVWEQQLPHRVRDLAAFVEETATNRETLEKQLDFAIKTAPKLTIQGGTTEVLRGIIARGLGLR